MDLISLVASLFILPNVELTLRLALQVLETSILCIRVGVILLVKEFVTVAAYVPNSMCLTLALKLLRISSLSLTGVFCPQENSGSHGTVPCLPDGDNDGDEGEQQGTSRK